MNWKGIVGICILVIIIFGTCIWLFNPTGPIASSRSEKFLLASDQILKDLECRDDCGYFGPSTFPITVNPHFECRCNKWLNETEQVQEINRMKKILEEKGWMPSQSNSLYETEASYSKDKLFINMQVYNWEGINNTHSRILIGFAHDIL